ncbi:desaturase [Lysobacteraceae bacterium NML93-0399]|nr:desaturase [Xanthomonadaceae bacterium NML93-0399]
MAEAFIALPAWQVVIFGVLWFGVLYTGTALATLALTRGLLPALGIGRVLDASPLPPGQIGREIGQSCSSILVFGLGLLLPWGMLRLGWARFAVEPSAWRIALEVAALFAWNELHFYACHRLLHSRPLHRFHADHHRARVPTPWSTYAFHPVEAMLLGSVPLLPMLLHDFSVQALAALPLMSILLNGLGHANYGFGRRADGRGLLGASVRHQQHHARYHGNYGFLLPWFDRALGTALPPARDSRPRGPRAPH